MLIPEDYYLTSLSIEHKDLIYKWRNSKYVHDYLHTNHLLTEQEHALWFDRALHDHEIIARLLVYQKQPIGFVNFTDIDQANKTCSWGFYIGEKHTPRGSGQIMLFMALDLIFYEFALRKVCSEILDFNSRSLYLHQKLGFTEEGCMKKQVYKNERYADVLLMGLFKDVWQVRREILLKEWRGYFGRIYQDK